jgi:hypothetical protein
MPVEGDALGDSFTVAGGGGRANGASLEQIMPP